MPPASCAVAGSAGQFPTICRRFQFLTRWRVSATKAQHKTPMGDALWSFMDMQVVFNAVSRPMRLVKGDGPQMLPCERVQPNTGRAEGEGCRGQRNVAFWHPGKLITHFASRGSSRNSRSCSAAGISVT